MDALLIPTFLCPKAWESMSGNEKERQCSYCNKSVHNLAALTARERLTLLSSPAASVCGRYKIALRRPAPGRRRSYTRHLLKYGASVAVTGSVLLVLWEMELRRIRDAATPLCYRTYPIPTLGCPGPEEMPDSWYQETEIPTVGMLMIMPATPPSVTACPPAREESPAYIDVKLDPIQMEGLLKAAPIPASPSIPLPAKPKKKAGHRPALWKLS